MKMWDIGSVCGMVGQENKLLYGPSGHLVTVVMSVQQCVTK